VQTQQQDRLLQTYKQQCPCLRNTLLYLGKEEEEDHLVEHGSWRGYD